MRNLCCHSQAITKAGRQLCCLPPCCKVSPWEQGVWWLMSAWNRGVGQGCVSISRATLEQGNLRLFCSPGIAWSLPLLGLLRPLQAVLQVSPSSVATLVCPDAGGQSDSLPTPPFPFCYAASGSSTHSPSSSSWDPEALSGSPEASLAWREKYVPDTISLFVFPPFSLTGRLHILRSSKMS